MYEYRVGIALEDGTWFENIYRREFYYPDKILFIASTRNDCIHVWLIALSYIPK